MADLRCPDCNGRKIHVLSTKKISGKVPVECAECDRLWWSASLLALALPKKRAGGLTK